MFHAEIEATNACNTRCLHCPHEVMTRPRGRMSWETFETITAKIRAHVRGEQFSLSFSGMGEPLLNPLLPRFVAHVARDARTSFACNGAVLTPENVRRLRDAGLAMIYLSFNGDEPGVYEQMMGGIPFQRVLGHLREAVALTRGSDLEIRANVSVTRQTRDRVGAIRQLLTDEGVRTVTFSLCHSRGGNLRDPSVCDTPAAPPDLTHCDVIRHTLFVDWRGRAYICDHDIHGEHELGDLMTEPLEAVLARRQELIDRGVSFKICRECNDLLKGGFHLFEYGAGGILTDWIYALHAPAEAEPFPAATPAQRWMMQLYQRENRLDRAVNRLISVAHSLQETVRVAHSDQTILRGEIEHLRRDVARHLAENDHLRQTLTTQAADQTILRGEIDHLRGDVARHVAENERLRQALAAAEAANRATFGRRMSAAIRTLRTVLAPAPRPAEPARPVI